MIRKQAELKQFFNIPGNLSSEAEVYYEEFEEEVFGSEDLADFQGDTVDNAYYFEENDICDIVETDIDEDQSSQTENLQMDFEEDEKSLNTLFADDVIEECVALESTHDELESGENLEKESFQESLSLSNSGAAQRNEDIIFHKTPPTLILTPNYLKAREALRNLPKQDPSQTLDYTVVMSDSGDNVVYVCTDSNCNAQFDTEEEMKCHMFDHNNGIHQCESCMLLFKTWYFYDKHVKECHSNKSWICQVCGKIFKTKMQLRSHVRNHDKTLRYKCTFQGCEKAFRVKHHLENHSRVHSKDSPFLCTFDGCRAQFRQKHALTIHLRKHNEEFKICEKCGSPFLTQIQLNKHHEKCDGTYRPYLARRFPYNRKNSVEPGKFECSVTGCRAVFKTKLTLGKHLTKAHQIAVTESTCVMCCQEFATPQEMKSHTREHRDLPFNCTICGLNLKSEQNLKTHLMKNHEKDEVRSYLCKECPVAFKRADHLKTHVTYKHKKERPYRCDSCSYTSSARKDMNCHMKTHIKQENFSCRLCNFTAKKLSTIKVHLKSIHGTEEYYCCNKCNQAFKYQNDFIFHQKEC